MRNLFKLFIVSILFLVSSNVFASSYAAIPTIAPRSRALSSSINDLNNNTGTAFGLLPDEDQLSRGTVTSGTDTGSADAYLVDLPTAPSGYVDNLQVVMMPINGNTGASTINVNSLGVITIKHQDGTSDLVAGDIVTGVPVDMRYSTVTGFFHVNQNSAVSAAAAAASAAASAASAVDSANSAAAALVSENNAAASAVIAAQKTLSEYGNDLESAVASIGSTLTTLTIKDSPNDLTGDLVVPSTLSLIWYQVDPLGGAYTLTINGSLTAGDFQLFGSSVTVVTSGKVLGSWFSSLDKAVNSGSLNVELSADTTYEISLSSTLAAGAIVHGPKSAIVKAMDAVVVFNMAYNTAIKGFEVDGNGLSKEGINSSANMGVTIKDMVVHDGAGGGKAGIQITNTDNYLIEHNEVYRTGQDAGAGIGQAVGIRCSLSDNGIIKNNYTHNNGRGTGHTDISGDGIYVAGCVNVVISLNISEENNRMGITLEDSGVTESTDIVISNNQVVNNGGEYTISSPDQIHSETSGRAVIEGNFVDASSGPDISNRGIASSHPENDNYHQIINANIVIGNIKTVGIKISSYDVITANQVFDCQAGIGNLGSGVGGAVVNYAVIQGNIIRNMQQEGIYGDSGATPVNVFGNSITGNTISNCNLETGNTNFIGAAIGIDNDITLFGSKIDDNIIYDDQGTETTYGGIVHEGESNSGSISGNIIRDMVSLGIHNNSATGDIVSFNTITGSTIAIKMFLSTECRITDNISDCVGGSGYVMGFRDMQYSTVSNNTIKNGSTAATDGIQFYTSTRGMFNNIISFNSVFNCTDAAIQVIPTASYNFNGNTIVGNATEGCDVGLEVSIDGEANYNIITNNNLRGNTSTSDIDAGDWGASSVLANNINP